LHWTPWCHRLRAPRSNSAIKTWSKTWRRCGARCHPFFICLSQFLVSTQEPGERPRIRSPGQSTFSCQRAFAVRRGKNPDRPRRPARRRSPSIRGIPQLSRRLTSMLPRGLWTNSCNVHTLFARERAVKPLSAGLASFSGLRPRGSGGLRHVFQGSFPRDLLTFPGGNERGGEGNGSFPRLRGTFPHDAHDVEGCRRPFPVPRTMRSRGMAHSPSVRKREARGMLPSGSSPPVPRREWVAPEGE
jgi:hypothetical protein